MAKSEELEIRLQTDSRAMAVVAEVAASVDELEGDTDERAVSVLAAAVERLSAALVDLTVRTETSDDAWALVLAEGDVETVRELRACCVPEDPGMRILPSGVLGRARLVQIGGELARAMRVHDAAAALIQSFCDRFVNGHPPEGSAMDHLCGCERWNGTQSCFDRGDELCDACAGLKQWRELAAIAEARKVALDAANETIAQMGACDSKRTRRSDEEDDS